MLAKAEESFLRQRSRIQWLAEGDCNSAFFYRALRSRETQNFINMLLDSDDAIINDPKEIREHIIEFYQGLLGPPGQTTTSSPDLVADLVPFRCSTAASNILTAPVTAAKIKEVIFSLPRNKSPGPDGYPAEFFYYKLAVKT